MACFVYYMKTKNDMKKVLNFLKKNSITTLATSLNDVPHASTVEYVMVGDSIIFATSPDSVKVNNLRKNNRLSMVVHNLPEFVMIEGSVVEATIDEINGYNKALYGNHPEFEEIMENQFMKLFIYFKVRIKKAYYNDYSNGRNLSEVISVD